MIHRLRGILIERHADLAVIEAAGVGYGVFASSLSLQAFGASGEEVSIWTYLQVREDAMTLFGFASREEYDAFRLLTGVQGVGGRVALAILSALPPGKLGMAIASGDRRALTQADGVGPKLAGRLISELKDRAGEFGGGLSGSAGLPSEKPKAKTKSGASPAAPGDIPAADIEDAVSALTNLGYSRSEAFAAVSAEIAAEGSQPGGFDALFRAALKRLGTHA